MKGNSTTFLSLHDLSVCSRAGDQDHEELALGFGNVVAVHGFTGGLADRRAMHDGTPHRVLGALVL